MVGAARSGRVAQDPLERVRRRAHHEVRAHEAGAVLVVVLDAVPGDVLAGDDRLAFLPAAREREAGDPVALGADQLVGVEKARIRSCSRWLLTRSTIGPEPPTISSASYLSTKVASPSRRAPCSRPRPCAGSFLAVVRAVRHQLGEGSAGCRARAPHVSSPDLLAHLLRGDRAAERRVDVVGIHAGRRSRRGACPSAS